MSPVVSQITSPRDCLLNRLFRRRSKKTSKPRVTVLHAGNSPVTGEFPTQKACNTENVSIWWHHDCEIRDHSGCGLSQWETALHCNDVSHWLSPFSEWFLVITRLICVSGFAAGISGKQTVQTSSGVPSFTAPQPIKRDPRQFQGIHVEPDSTKPKTVLSSSRVIALKGTIQNVKSTVEQLRTYVSQVCILQFSHISLTFFFKSLWSQILEKSLGSWAGWETKIFWYSPELGSLLYSLYKIPLAQACFPLIRPNFHWYWRAGER